MHKTLTFYPFLLHSLSMSVFSSVIGPFGGFFASGFKRAFKIKVNLELLSSFFFDILFEPSTGLWRYDSGTWWHHGSLRLSVLDGHICERLHFQFYSYRIAG